ncbi:hydrolase [Streptacidiphilus cavernicola]|uniref:Hydrolase n=1 Tax=Streptacidiphilus cavernicola TaxID=3342716 RepID=A0ABV6VTZ1_9ACTN
MPADMPTSEPAGTGGPALLLSGARLPDGRSVDVRIIGERIEAVGPAGTLSAAERVDLTGYLLLPAPVEAHAHLDQAFTGTPVPGAGAGVTGRAEPDPGSVLDASLGSAPGWERDVGRGSGARQERLEDLQRRITEAALTGLGYGATVQRTHIRIGGAQGLVGMTAALQAARALHGLMDLQVVPLPGLLTGIAGAEGRAMLREALGMGAHAVGGRPDGDPDPDGHLDAVVALAEEHGLPLDLHTDAADPRRLTRLASVLGTLSSRAVIGPCSALGLLPPEVAARCVEQLAAARVSVVVLPQCARCTGSTAASGATAASGVAGSMGSAAPAGSAAGLAGVAGSMGVAGPAGSAGPVGRPLSARMLLAAGVPVAAGSGALRDTANPVGRVDPLEAAFLLTASGELGETAAYGAVSVATRAAFGLPPVLLAPGCPAEVLAVRGESLRGALSGGHSRVVVHAGRIVSRTSAVREFAETSAPAVPRQGRSGPPC